MAEERLRCSVFVALSAIIRRDIRIAARRLHHLSLPLAFLVIVVSLFPLAIDPEPAFLRKIAPGVIWIAALLATLLMVDGMFREDYENGTLEVLAVAEVSLVFFALARVVSSWLLSGIPLIFLGVVAGLMLNLPTAAVPVTVASLVLGTPTLHLIGAIGAALTVAAGHRGGLLALLVLPLYLPVLIFGVSAIGFWFGGLTAAGPLLLLAALLTLALTLGPLAIAAALRISLG